MMRGRGLLVVVALLLLSAFGAVVALVQSPDKAELHVVTAGPVEIPSSDESLDALVARNPDHAALPVVPPPSGRLLAVGQLEDDRVVGLAPTAVAAGGVGEASDGLPPVRGASVLTGPPLHIQPHGRYLVVVATAHPDVVRLAPDWRTRDVLSMRAVFPVKGDLLFGPPVPVSASEVVVPVAFDDSLGLVRIDVEAWQVTASRVYDDRYGGFPQACAAGGSVVVGSTGWVDRFDARSLEREASVAHEWARGLACEGGRVWLADGEAATGRVLDLATLGDVGEFSWDGRSGGEIRVAGDEVVGVDEAAGVVYACPKTGGRCRVGEVVGGRPRGLVVDGDLVFVGLQESRAVAAVERSTLRAVGRVRLPAMVRGMAIYEVG